jgi:hypothetical protein
MLLGPVCVSAGNDHGHRHSKVGMSEFLVEPQKLKTRGYLEFEKLNDGLGELLRCLKFKSNAWKS